MFEIALTSESVLADKNKIIGVCRDVNLIYKTNFETGKTELIGKIPEESRWTNRVCRKILFYNNMYIFVPMNAKKIWIFDVSTSIWKGIELPTKKYQDIPLKFGNAFIYKNSVIMIGHFFPGIISLNLKNFSINEYFSPYEKLKNLQKQEHDCFTMFRYEIKDNMLYLASSISNQIIIINLDTFDYKLKSVGSEKCKFSGILWDGEKFWISPRKNTDIIIWNEEKFKTLKLTDTFFEEKPYFWGIERFENKIVLPGCEGGKTLIIHNEKIKKILEKEYNQYELNEKKELVSCLVTGKTCLTNNKNYEYYLNPKLTLNNYFEFLLAEGSYTEKTEKETKSFRLNLWMQYLINKKENSICKLSEKGIGKNIYEVLFNTK